MASILRTAAAFRAAVLRRESQALAQMQRAYLTAYQDIAREALGLLEGGGFDRLSTRVKFLRLEALLSQAAEQVQRYGLEAVDLIKLGQADLVARSIDDAKTLATLRNGSVAGVWNRIPVESLEHLVGTLSDGSPLRDLFDQFGEIASQGGRDAIASALAQGFNPRDAARNLRRGLETGEPAEGFAKELLGPTGKLKNRAETIARTEMLRSYREAGIENYRANSDIVTGWEWLATKDLRTCPVCLAMDGTIHSNDEVFGSHPNCRCTTLPIVDGEVDPRETGSEWFEKLDRVDQIKVLGPGKQELFDSGRITLSDLVASGDDPKWGPWRAEKSLARIKQEIGNEPPSPPANSGRTGGDNGDRIFVSSRISLDDFSETERIPVASRLNLIDSIHSDGKLPRINLKKMTEREVDEMGAAGYFSPSGAPGGPLMAVDLNRPKMANTLVHETGHFIDIEGLGNGKSGASSVSRQFKGWRDAIKSTAPYKDIDRLRRKIRDQGRKYGVLPVQTYDLLEYLNYLLQPEELWARSYVQFIASESAERQLLDEIEFAVAAHQRGDDPPIYWSWEEFAAIGQEIKKIFAAHGWL